MQTIGIPMLALKSKPLGRIDAGRPEKIWKDQLNPDVLEAGTKV